MSSLPRRSPVGFRKDASRVKRPRAVPVRLMLGGIVILCLTGGLLWYLTRKPRGYECLTDLSTVCPEEISVAFESLSTTPLWKISLQTTHLTEQATLLPRFKDAKVTVSPLQVVSVRASVAESLFPFSAEGKHWMLLSNGKREEQSSAAFPSLEVSSLALMDSLSQEDLGEMAKLYQRLRSFSPRIRKVLLLSTNEIEVYPENSGKVLFMLQGVERQLATLQAFFRSTTIDQTYQILDVRFTDVAVIKE